MQVTGRRASFGSPTGLYDVRLGEDMHVLVACGLGGGSLVNAGVALRPDARVFADAVWPGQIAQDGLLDEGYARAGGRTCEHRVTVTRCDSDRGTCHRGRGAAS